MKLSTQRAHPPPLLDAPPRLGAYILRAKARSVLSAPGLYSLAIPIAILDCWITLYQWLVFPLLRISLVNRGEYIALDRQRLPYLNVIEKMNCAYCGYSLGVLAYVTEIAARTEQYWCPIKHERVTHAPHGRYHLFADYGDAYGYRRGLPRLRRALKERRS